MNCRYSPRKAYFNPRAPCGARPVRSARQQGRLYFNPRAPCGARPENTFNSLLACIISIHGLRVEPDMCGVVNCVCIKISIHGLRVEPDMRGELVDIIIHISIHGLRVEPDYFQTNERK